MSGTSHIFTSIGSSEPCGSTWALSPSAKSRLHNWSVKWYYRERRHQVESAGFVQTGILLKTQFKPHWRFRDENNPLLLFCLYILTVSSLLNTGRAEIPVKMSFLLYLIVPVEHVNKSPRWRRPEAAKMSDWEALNVGREKDSMKDAG